MVLIWNPRPLKHSWYPQEDEGHLKSSGRRLVIIGSSS